MKLFPYGMVRVGPASSFYNHHSCEAVKPLKTAILVGALSAAITWVCVYFAIHEPSSHRMPDGSIQYVHSYPGEDDDLTAMLWAAGSYILTFTPTLVLGHRRTRKDAFAS